MGTKGVVHPALGKYYFALCFIQTLGKKIHLSRALTRTYTDLQASVTVRDIQYNVATIIPHHDSVDSILRCNQYFHGLLFFSYISTINIRLNFTAVMVNASNGYPPVLNMH